jgi:hypothetical protein
MADVNERLADGQTLAAANEELARLRADDAPLLRWREAGGDEAVSEGPQPRRRR